MRTSIPFAQRRGNFFHAVHTAMLPPPYKGSRKCPNAVNRRSSDDAQVIARMRDAAFASRTPAAIPPIATRQEGAYRMNTRTRMQLLAAFAATTVLFAAGCDQRNATDRTASSGSTPGGSAMTSTTPATKSPGTTSSADTSSSAPSSSSMANNSASSSASGSSSMMASADDATITTKVKAAVMSEP